MSDIYIYILNSSPVVKTRRSVDSFVEPTYMKEISRKSVFSDSTEKTVL